VACPDSIHAFILTGADCIFRDHSYDACHL